MSRDPRIALLMCTGFTAPPWIDKDSGVYAVVDHLIEGVPELQNRLTSWIQVTVEYCDFVDDVASLLSFQPDIIIRGGHSFGSIANAGKRFARRLAEASDHTAVVDLEMSIDSVPPPPFEPVRTWFDHTEVAVEVPNNVRDCLQFRTLNQLPFHPWGRRLSRAIRLVTFGGDLKDRDDGVIREVQDSEVNHGTIDNHPIVAEECVAAVQRLVRDWRARNP